MLLFRVLAVVAVAPLAHSAGEPIPVEGCLDGDDHYDGNGMTCFTYTLLEEWGAPGFCDYANGNPDTADFTPRFMCCACVGACEDPGPDTVDSVNNNCSDYWTPGTCRGGVHDDTDFTANDMCCDCKAWRFAQCPATSGLCSLSELPDQVHKLCQTSDVHRAPLKDVSDRVDVGLSWVFMAVHELDEAKKTLTMSADIQAWWHDCRYDVLAQLGFLNRFFCPNVRQAKESLTAMSGFSSSWHEVGMSIVRAASKSKLTSGWCPTLPNFISLWHPMPHELRLKDADNYRSMSDGDIYFKPMPEITPGTWSALVQDSAKLTFSSINMNYRHFPFDEHDLDLVLKFDHTVRLELHEGLLAGSGILPLSSIQDRTQHEYEPSEFNARLNEKVVGQFGKLGWTVLNASVYTTASGPSNHAHFEISIRRDPTLILMRFFLPLALLTVIPFAGFYLPVSAVMPRVATGFISFLTMTVFRNMAYSMVPRKTTYVVWLDSVMITATETVWLAVIQNVVAQWVNAQRSKFVASLVDKMAQQGFPVMIALQLIIMLMFGVARWDEEACLVTTQLITAAFIISMGVRLLMLFRNTNVILTRELAKVLSQTDNIMSEDDMRLDSRDMGIIFVYVDRVLGDASGSMNQDELLKALKAKGGFSFAVGREAAQEEAFRRAFTKHISSAEFGLDQFRAKFKNVVNDYAFEDRELRRKKKNEGVPDAT